MRRIIETTLVLHFLVLSATADASWWVGVGNGGRFEESSISLGMRGSEWGLGIGVIFNSDYTDEEIYDYPVPHTSFVILDTDAHIGNTFGMDAFRFFDITEAQSVFVGLGVYFSDVCELARSNATGWLYCQRDKGDIEVAGSMGYMFTLDVASLGIGYHSVRGIELTAGMSW